MQLSERLGDWIGGLWGPLFAVTSRVRKARTFHPRGDLVRVSLMPVHPGPGEWSERLGELGERLAGEGLLRFSSALWKRTRWPDALGCALAMLGNDGHPEQHLLFATIRRPWTMPFAPFATEVSDYLANDYFAVSPFSAPRLPRLWLRLHPETRPRRGEPSPRRERLSLATQHQRTLLLEAGDSPWGPWTPFVRVTLLEMLEGDPPGFEFDPFLDARGLVPHGFIHALRRGAYQGSRSGREPSVPAGLPRSN